MRGAKADTDGWVDAWVEYRTAPGRIMTLRIAKPDQRGRRARTPEEPSRASTAHPAMTVFQAVAAAVLSHSVAATTPASLSA